MLNGLSDAEYIGISSAMMAAWTRFAHTGTPTIPHAVWPAYDMDRRTTFCFGPLIGPVGDPAGANWRLASNPVKMGSGR